MRIIYTEAPQDLYLWRLGLSDSPLLHYFIVDLGKSTTIFKPNGMALVLGADAL